MNVNTAQQALAANARLREAARELRAAIGRNCVVARITFEDDPEVLELDAAIAAAGEPVAAPDQTADMVALAESALRAATVTAQEPVDVWAKRLVDSALEAPAPVVGLHYAESGPAAGYPIVHGKCPACGLSSLFLGVGGHVTCASLTCRAPGQANDMLAKSAPAPDEGDVVERAALIIDGAHPYGPRGLIAAERLSRAGLLARPVDRAKLSVKLYDFIHGTREPIGIVECGEWIDREIGGGR